MYVLCTCPACVWRFEAGNSLEWCYGARQTQLSGGKEGDMSVLIVSMSFPIQIFSQALKSRFCHLLDCKCVGLFYDLLFFIVLVDLNEVIPDDLFCRTCWFLCLQGCHYIPI